MAMGIFGVLAFLLGYCLGRGHEIQSRVKFNRTLIADLHQMSAMADDLVIEARKLTRGHRKDGHDSNGNSLADLQAGPTGLRD